ncbi:hypothetical protein RRG08_000016 [Elysia crispata]|uniref:Uncharacterized protein n=1 Tax=Elysia crispata TaxID=231223 RepID=A0AAE1CT95_9GAST|nr:hypothetical protein RRG08_000016 [Elysia crispata]
MNSSLTALGWHVVTLIINSHEMFSSYRVISGNPVSMHLLLPSTNKTNPRAVITGARIKTSVEIISIGSVQSVEVPCNRELMSCSPSSCGTSQPMTTSITEDRM